MKASGVMLFGGSRAAAFPTTVTFGRGKLTVRCYSSSSPGTANVFIFLRIDTEVITLK